MLVDQMYAVIPHTNKSLVTLFAGIYPSIGHKIVEAQPGRIPGPGLPSLLEPLGYESAFFTPAMLSFERKDRILGNLGFHHVAGHGDFESDLFYQVNPLGYEDRVTLSSIFEWVDRTAAEGKPFLLGYLSMTTHHPYTTPPGFEKHEYIDRNSADERHLNYERFNQYHNAVRYTDDFVPDLFDGFVRRDLIDNTVFIVLGDHGEAFGEHGVMFHADVLYEEALRVPAIVYNPVLFEEAVRVEGPRQLIDFAPTIADLLGLETRGGSFPGQSLLSEPDPERSIYYTTWSERYGLALRQGDGKFIFYYDMRPTEVFDIRLDPDELRNIRDQIDTDSLAEIETRLLKWRIGTKAAYHPTP